MHFATYVWFWSDGSQMIDPVCLLLHFYSNCNNFASQSGSLDLSPWAACGLWIGQHCLRDLCSTSRKLITVIHWDWMLVWSLFLDTGTRFYFTTTRFPDPQGLKLVPCMLTLVHVRFPPGHTIHSSQGSPKNVHSAFYSRGMSSHTVLMKS